MFFVGNFSQYFCFFRPEAIIEVSGEDALNFLQGQFTNELRKVPGSATYGLWLNQKGKVLADSHILRRDEREFTLISASSGAATILPRLEQYIIADDVTLLDRTTQMGGLVIWGEDSGQLLRTLAGSLPESGEFLAKDDVMIFAGQRTSGENYELIGLEGSINEWGQKLAAQGCTPTPVSALEVARISSGIPSVPQDIGPTDLPNEAGLENTAISFTKGCYLGQEVMARLKNLGQVRRQLRSVRGIGGLPKTGKFLFQAAKKVGEIRSVAATEEGFVALAMLTRMGLDEKAGFTFEPTDQAVTKADVWTS
jgi:folate-binding protein YgfZ